MANLIKTSDRRETFTHNEVQQVALALKDRTEILSNGTDYTYESGKTKRKLLYNEDVENRND